MTSGRQGVIDLESVELRMLGVRVHPLTQRELHEVIDVAVMERRKAVIGHHNLHSIYLVHHDRWMAEFDRRADCQFVDGMGVVALARLILQPLHRRHRITYADWIDPLCDEATRRNWRLVHVGGLPGVGERAVCRLVRRHPGLRLDTIPGYFDARPGSDGNRDVLQRIRSAQPDVLLVGMGVPRQERWVLENLGELDAGAVLTCGACMDYVAGEIGTPPRWAGAIGLEWLFRLVAEPRRLARRYLVEPWFLVGQAVRERTGSRRRPR